MTILSTPSSIEHAPSICNPVVAHQISLQTEYVAGYVAALSRASHLALIPVEAAMREPAGVLCGEGEEKKKIRHRDVVDSLTMVS